MVALVVLGGYVLLAVIVFGSAWLHPSSVGIGIGQDPPQFMWFFTWPGFALGHLQNPFLTTHVDYPTGANLLWNCAMLLVGFVVWPVRALFGPVLTFNLVETLALALSAWTAFLWLRRHVTHPLAAAVGAALYGFSPGILGQSLGHPHITMAFMPPLMLIVLEDLVITQRRSAVRLGVLLGAMAAAQLLIGEEVLATTAVIGALALALLAGMYPAEVRPRLPRVAGGLALAAGVFVVLAAVPLAYQFFGPQRIFGLVHAPDVYVSDLLSFITPNQMQLLAPELAVRLFARFSGSSIAESNAYLGIPLILLLIFCAVRFWDRLVVRMATLLAAILAALSMGSTIHVAGHLTRVPVYAVLLILPLFWRVLPVPAVFYTFLLAWLGLTRVGLLQNILPVRLTIYVYLFAGVLLAFFLDAVVRHRSSWAVGGVATALALTPLLPALPYPATAADVPAYFAGQAVDRIAPGSVALLFPMADSSHAQPMLWQAAADLRFRMPAGYLFVPGSRTSLDPPPPNAALDVSLAVEAGADPATLDVAPLLDAARRWHVQTVIVGPMPHQDQMVALVTRALGRSPQATGGVYLWEQVAP